MNPIYVCFEKTIYNGWSLVNLAGSNCFVAMNDPFLMAMSLCAGIVASSCLCRGVINNITMLMAKFKLVVASLSTLSAVLGHHRFLPD